LLDKRLPGRTKTGWFALPIGRDKADFAPATPQAEAFLYGLKEFAEKSIATEDYPLSGDIFWLYRERWYKAMFVDKIYEERKVKMLMLPSDYHALQNPAAGGTSEHTAASKAKRGRIRFPCSHCGKPLAIQPADASKRIKCPGCGQRCQVPRQIL